MDECRSLMAGEMPIVDGKEACAAQKAGGSSGPLVHSSAGREHFLWDVLSHWRVSVTKTAQVELRSGRV